MNAFAPLAAPPRLTLAPLLALSGVSKRYDGVHALEDVTLEAHAGEVFCLLGPSGCGKSTLLRIAAGVERQDAGDVRIKGELVSDGARHAPPEARGIGLMFQDFALFPHLDIGQNVAFGLRGLSAPERAETARRYLDRVGLDGYADRFPHQLSGGEQQRVALARALAPRPKALLMDEPFSGLDKRLRDVVRDETLALLKEEGAAVLLVTHEPEEALRMADRIALMRDGRVVQIGAPWHIYHNPADRRAAAFFSDVNVVHGIVRNRQTDTPFGLFLTPGLLDGAEVEVIIRPQHLMIEEDRGAAPGASARAGMAAQGRVVRARFMGSESLIETRMDHDGAVLRATVPGAWLPPPDTPVLVSLRREFSFVFPCERQSRLGEVWEQDRDAAGKRTG